MVLTAPNPINGKYRQRKESMAYSGFTNIENALAGVHHHGSFSGGPSIRVIRAAFTW